MAGPASPSPLSTSENPVLKDSSPSFGRAETRAPELHSQNPRPPPDRADKPFTTNTPVPEPGRSAVNPAPEICSRQHRASRNSATEALSAETSAPEPIAARTRDAPSRKQHIPEHRFRDVAYRRQRNGMPLQNTTPPQPNGWPSALRKDSPCRPCLGRKADRDRRLG